MDIQLLVGICSVSFAGIVIFDIDPIYCLWDSREEEAKFYGTCSNEGSGFDLTGFGSSGL